MPFTLSPEAAAKAAQIPEFSARLERFINDQFALEEWRVRRRNAAAAAIVAEGLKQGAALRAANPDPDELFARLAELTARLSHGQ